MIPELGSEPPAIANFLTHDLSVTHEAIPATLIDLAARRVIRLTEIGPDNYQCELRGGEHEPLTSYEQRVIQLLIAREEDGIVPAGALTTGWEEESLRWSEAFSDDVRDDAERRGLTSLRRGAWLTLVALAVLALLGVLAWSLVPWENTSPPVVGLVVLGCLAAVYLITITMESRPPVPMRRTAAGRAASARWRAVARALHEDESFDVLPAPSVAIWDRYLAYAVALGLARAAGRGLPMGTDSTRTAWSAAGGQWRRLRLRYPRIVPLGWGCAPKAVLVLGAAGTVAGTAMLVFLGSEHAALLGAGIALVSWSAILCALAAVDLLRDARTIRGEVVRLYVRQGRRWNPWADLFPPRFYVAVDGGQASRLRGFVVTPVSFYGLREGDHVTVIATRNLGYVRELNRA